MSASKSKTFMSPNFLTEFLEEYRELPVLWQVRSPDYSNRAKRHEAWDLLVQFTREKIPDADLCFIKKKKKRTVSGHHLGTNCAEFGIVVLSPLLQLASMNSFWILKCTSKVGSPLMCVW
jgi:hypothetical protein